MSSSDSSGSKEPAFTNIFRQANTSRPKPIPIAFTNKNGSKHLNRHTIMVGQQDNFDRFYLNTKIEDDTFVENFDPSRLNGRQYQYYQTQSNETFDMNPTLNTNNNSPLSKTPDSNTETDIGNWIELPDSGIGGGGSSGVGGGDSVGTIGDSDPEMVESNNQSINHDEELDWAEEELDSAQTVLITSGMSSDSNSNLNPTSNVEDFTTKRLKTFVATTLHNEHVYLDKIGKLLNFRIYLEDNFSGSQTDINVLFSDIFQIYKIHEVVAIKLQEYLDSFSELSRSHTTNNQSNALIKEKFLSSALQLLANIMEISFPVYLEFVENYPRSMSLLNKLEKQQASLTAGLLSKRKPFLDCQADFNTKSMNNKLMPPKDKRTFFHTKKQATNNSEFSLYYDTSRKPLDDKIDVAKLFSEEILRRPSKLFLFIHSLKDECMLAANELSVSSSNGLRSNIKSMFDNEESKVLRDKVFEQIKLNIMPKEARKHEDVVELCENNNERKLRHLILYGDCLVCCRLKKDKRQLKWFIPIDKLEIALDDYKSAKSENELRSLRAEHATLQENLKKEQNVSNRNLQRIKKKIFDHENELTLQSSRLKLIIRSNPALVYAASSSGSPKMLQQNKANLNNLFSSHLTAIGNSMTNISLISGQNQSNKHTNNHLNNNPNNLSTSQISYSSISSSNNNNNTSHSSNSQYVFLFTSDFERTAWLEEMNSAIFAYKTRKTTLSLQQSDIESRIIGLKKMEEPMKAVTSSCTGSLELTIKQIEELSQPNRVFVAVELKSCGSYLQVAQTKCTELTTSPIWNEKFTLELQCVDSLRIILYGETSGKAIAIASQELKIDSNINLNKINCSKLSNGITVQISMKFLSPKKTITRRRTRNRNDIFGGNLADQLQREKTSIPRILKDCVEVIETKGIDEVGIYRVSSVVSEVQKMKDLYSKNPNQALGELRQKSPHLSANVLKLYLRELPDPLFTSHLYHKFMAALDWTVPEFRSVELCRIFNDLPESNKTIILFVLTHLLNISLRSDKNMMGLQNLCTLFGPTLMKLSPKDNLQVDDMAKEIKESMQQAQVLFYILKLHEENRLIVDPEQKEQLNLIAQSHALANPRPQHSTNARKTSYPFQADFNSNSNNSFLVKKQDILFNPNNLAGKDERLARSNMQTAL